MLDGFRHDLPDLRPEDVIGSPYAVQEYAVNREIGTPADLAAVRGVLAELGMRLMLDFVPNHGAVDSELLRTRPAVLMERPSGSFPADWWVRRGGKTYAFGRGPYDGPWTDTVQYNYWSPETVSTMTDILLSIASQADAIRCDMAMLVLNDVIERTWDGVMRAGGFSRPNEEFWKVAIDAVRAQYPDTVFMAEAYDYHFTTPPEKQKLQGLGFDVVYDKTILDDLNTGNLDVLRGYIGSQGQAFFSHTAHFVENHDEPRSVAALGGPQQAFAGAVVASTIPGLRLFYFGQFDGLSAKLAVQLRRATSQAPDPALHAQYRALLRALADPVFHGGSWAAVPSPRQGSGWRLCAWRWTSSDGTRKRLVVVNFSDGQAWANIPVADAEGPPGTDSVVLTELLTGSQYVRSSTEMRTTGLTCGLPAWTSQIFSYDGGTAPAPMIV